MSSDHYKLLSGESLFGLNAILHYQSPAEFKFHDEYWKQVINMTVLVNCTVAYGQLGDDIHHFQKKDNVLHGFVSTAAAQANIYSFI